MTDALETLQKAKNEGSHALELLTIVQRQKAIMDELEALDKEFYSSDIVKQFNEFQEDFKTRAAPLQTRLQLVSQELQALVAQL